MTEEEREDRETPAGEAPTEGVPPEQEGPETEAPETDELSEESLAADAASAKPSVGPRYDQDEGRVQSTATERGTRKERVGMVVSDAAQRTVTVSVETLMQHKLYKKRVRRSKKFLVHDEHDEARVGDTVRIMETRPLSKRKRWRLANIIARAE